VILGERRFKEATARYRVAVRKGLPANDGGVQPLDLAKVRTELASKLKRAVNDDDLFSHLMYPEVFAAFDKHRQDYSDVSVLPTPSFFYGLYQRQEINVTIEPGKTLIIRLVNVSEAEKDGRRTVTVELNGMTRETYIADKQLAPKAKLRPKADLKNPAQVPAPIPGLIASIAVSVGTRSAKVTNC